MKIQVKDFTKYLLNRRDKTIDIPEETVKFLKEQGLSELESLEQSDVLIEKIKRFINKEIEGCKNQGITPQYTFDESNDDILIRTDLSVEAHEEKITRAVIECKQQISQIINKISWREFEKICKIVLEINYVYDCKVTRGSKDGGIDVYGWLKIKHINSRRIYHDVVMRVVGQGKHRNNGGTVANADVSEFVTDVGKLRRKQGFSLFSLTPEFVSSSAPLIPIFITNGYFRGDAKDTA